MDNLIFVLNGPSAGGKTILLETITGEKLIKGIESLSDMAKLVTVTTRNPRPEEIEEIHYYFVTPDEFQKKKREGDVVEETVYAGVQYGIFDSEIQRIRNANKDALVILDKHGISEMKRFYGDKNVISIFVYRDLKDIFAELKRRPVSMQETMKRFEQAKEEMKNISICDYAVYNISTVQDLAKDAIRIIQKERSKKRRREIKQCQSGRA
ncbi:MAG: hypothetical protein PHN69_05500 [Candidatus Pacebacteria bacterium]|nr:hypothetical protein [Candidatus Paceibacterota bacterium]